MNLHDMLVKLAAIADKLARYGVSHNLTVSHYLHLEI